MCARVCAVFRKKLQFAHIKTSTAHGSCFSSSVWALQLVKVPAKVTKKNDAMPYACSPTAWERVYRCSQHAWEAGDSWNRNTTYSEHSCSHRMPYYLVGEIFFSSIWLKKASVRIYRRGAGSKGSRIFFSLFYFPMLYFLNLHILFTSRLVLFWWNAGVRRRLPLLRGQHA